MKSEAAGVQSVDRALQILTALSDEPDGLRLVEVAQSTQLPVSTVHRLLNALAERRFAHFDQPHSAWRVGPAAFRAGSAFARRNTFAAPALPAMRRLRDATRETVSLAAPDDGEVIVLAQVESREIVRAINRIGGRAPMTSSALGKALLATYDSGALRDHLDRHGMPRATAKTRTDAEALRQDLERARLRGFAIDLEEHGLGLHCVAAPIFDGTGEAVAALSVSGLAARLSEDDLDRIGPAVCANALAITRSLAGALPAHWPAPPA